MTTKAITGRPSNAASIWQIGLNIYLELPCPPGGVPHIMEFSATENGLGKALSFIKKDCLSDGVVRGGTPVNRPITRLPAKDNFSDAQKDNAREVLRKIGML